MSSVDSITITSVSTVNQIEITSTDGITVTTVGTQGLAGPSAIMQKGVDATTIGAGGNGSFLVYDHTNSQWTSSTSTSVANLTVEIQKLRIGGTGATVVSILDEDNMASDSATSLATQQSIKAYVESRVGIDNLAALLVGGNTTGGTDISVSANDDITFADSSKSIYGAGSDLQIYHDGTNSFIANSQGALKIATETSGITVNIGHTTSTVAVGDDLTVAGNQTISGTLGVTGAITGSLTGNVTGQVSDISNFTTANLTENTNLYFTNERVDDRVSNLLVAGTGITLTYDDNSNTLTIDGQVGDITSVVAGDGLTGGGTSGDVTLTVNVDNSSIEINSDTLRIKALGVTNDMLSGSIPNSKLANSDFSINSNTLVLGNSIVLDTDDIGEGSNNQYYTTSRANSDFDIRLATKDTDDLAEGVSRLYYTTARANSAIDNRVTKSFVDALGVQAGSVTANSVALGTDTTGDYIQTITGTANKITVSGSGSESADVTLTLPDDVQIANNLTVAGNLTVNGTLTSLDTTNLDIEDNLFLLNAGLTGSPVNDSGMLINRGSSTNAVFMWDESVDKFTLGLTSADGTATGNITVSSLGTLVANLEGNVTGNVTGNSSTATALETGRTIALSGDVTASGVSFDGSGNITLTTTIEPNSVALGTDTTGNYVASLVEGTGVTISNNTGENATPTIAIGQVVSTTSDVTFNTVTADIIGNINGATEFSAQAGEALSKGDAVYISGISGNTPIVSKADADDSNKMPSFGLAKADANLNANVVVVTFGTLSGLDTSSFSAGDILFISTTAGTLSATAPTGESSLIQNIGIVQRSHASAGSIKVGGAGRTNATPNLNNGKIFLGNGSNQAVSTTLDTSVVPENTNLYYTDARAQAVSINNVVEDTTPQLGGNLDLNSSDITGTGNINVTGDITLGDINPTITFNDSSVTNLSHTISSASDNLKIQVDANGVDAGSRVEIFDGTTEVARFEAGAVDVTGTVTADGLTVDGTAVTVATFNTNVNGSQIIINDGTSSTVPWNVGIKNDGSNDFLIYNAGAENIELYTSDRIRQKIGSNGDISFYEDTGTTAKFFWDASAESLGIGTTSPSTKLSVHAAINNPAIEIVPTTDDNNADTAVLRLWGTRFGTANRYSEIRNVTDGSTANNELAFNTNGTERMRINSAGDVGIGTSSPNLHGWAKAVTLDTATNAGYELGQSGTKYGAFALQGDGRVQLTNFTSNPLTFQTNNTERMRIDAAGNVGIGNSSPARNLSVNSGSSSGYIQLVNTASGTGSSNGLEIKLDSGGAEADIINRENGRIGFWTNNTEKMRIDASGNVGIGTSSPTRLLHISSSENQLARFESTDSYGGIELCDNTSGTAKPLISALGNELIFYNGGSTHSEAVRISSGNVGIGTTSPSALLHLKATGGSVIQQFETTGGTVARTWKNFVSASTGSYHIQDATASANRVIIDTSGNVGIGTASPDGKVHIESSSSGATAGAGGDELILESSATTGLSILSGTANDGNILFGDSGNSAIGYVQYKHADNALNFGVNGGTKATIDSSGNVRVGVGNTFEPTIQFTNSGRVASNPGYSFNGDLDTGMFNPSTQGTIAFSNNGTESMRIDSSGNVGIGASSPKTTLNLAANNSGQGAILTLENTDTSITSNDVIGQIDFYANDGSTNGTGAKVNIKGIATSTAGTITALTFGTANSASSTAAERMRIDGSGNVGIGTTNPQERLEVYDSSGTDVLTVTTATATANTTGASLLFRNLSSSATGAISKIGIETGSAIDRGSLVFSTSNASNSPTERMRIDSSGNLLVGVTAYGDSGGGTYIAGGLIKISNSVTTNAAQMYFTNANGVVGSITSNGSATAFNTSSDARLKDVTGEARGLEVINELNPVAYNWKADGKADEGLIAQEVLDVVPNAVSQNEENQMYQMDYSKLVVHLVKGMKEQQAQIEALQSEINLLKGE